MNLQEVVEAIYYRKSKASKKVVVTNNSDGSIKTYIVFFIVKLCKTF